MGAGISAYGQRQQAKAEKKMYERQAALEVQRAAEARSRAADLALERSEERRQEKGSALVAAAAGGVALDASPLDATPMWEQDQAALGAYETDKIHRDAELQAWGFLSNADALRYQGKMARYAAKFRIASSLMSTAGSESSKVSSYGSSFQSAS